MNTNPKPLERSARDIAPLEPAAQPAREASPSPVASAAPSEELTLRGFGRLIAEGRWAIAICTMITIVGGSLYLVMVSPIYRADALVQVEEGKNGQLGLHDALGLYGGASPADAEMEILRSRMLIGSVIEQLHLDVKVQPRYFPIIGKAVARRHLETNPARPVLGMSSFAWGGERIEVPFFEVPPQLEGEKHTVIARAGRGYDLVGPDGVLLGRGEAGKSSTFGETTILISGLTAREGTEFQVTKVPLATAIEVLRKDLLIAERGKKTGMIEVAMEIADPGLACATLDSITRTYLRQNVERRSAEAEKTLEFINRQLPQLKVNAENAEAELNSYRKSRRGGFDFSAETKATLDRSADIERMLTELELQRSEMKERFTSNHPAFRALDAKGAALRSDREALDRQMQKLPETEFQAVRLMREVKAASELYVLLLNKAQELSVVKSGTVGNVRILDKALASPKPVSPLPGVALLLSILAGLGGGVAIVFARKALAEGVDDPEVIERETGLPVFATIPHSSDQSAHSAEQQQENGGMSLLAATHPDDLAIEALRSLRTSVQLAASTAHGNIIAIMGPSPGVGKSFVSANLAYVLADAGSRVLLVDADLRKGTLHHHLGTPMSPGLSDLVQGTMLVADALKRVSTGLHFIPCGERTANPSELLSSRRFDELLAMASSDYDFVLVDTAPILAVTDGVLAARRAGTALLVLRAGQHTIREITTSLKQAAQNAVQPRAIIINDMRRQLADYSYNRYGHSYRLRPDAGARKPSRRG
jgi:tyrosine-protein kinase Etk/Wzc